MISLSLLSLLLVTATRSANVIDRLSVQDGAICDDRIPAYLVADSHKLAGAESKVTFKDVSEQECKNMCTDNKDDGGNQVMCSSFVYNIKEKSCSIYRGKAMPAGKLEMKPAAGLRYYEKFCLPEGTPADCGEAPFFRADQAVLIGFAKNVTHTKNLATCIQACIEMSAECRSSMFFGSAGECILSVASAQDAPDVFADEEDEENVVYFENGCVLENQIRTQKKQNSRKTSDAKKPSPTIKVSTNSTGLKPANASRPASPSAAEAGKKAPKGLSGERKKAKGSEEEDSPKKPDTESAEEDREDKSGRGAGDDSQESKRGKTDNPRRRVTASVPLGGKSGKGGPKRLLVQNASSSNGAEEAWGPWSEECRSFDERRPCQNGNRVGFQSRQCLRTPFECQGPFFRYCIAPC